VRSRFSLLLTALATSTTQADQAPGGLIAVVRQLSHWNYRARRLADRIESARPRSLAEAATMLSPFDGRAFELALAGVYGAGLDGELRGWLNKQLESELDTPQAVALARRAGPDEGRPDIPAPESEQGGRASGHDLEASVARLGERGAAVAAVGGRCAGGGGW